MKLNSTNHTISRTYLAILLISLLSSCAPKPALSSPTAVPPRPTDADPATATQVPASEDRAQLIPAGNVRAYPGPEHYAGDVLTFEIPDSGRFLDQTFTVSMALDNNKPIKISVTGSWNSLLLPFALDTTDLSGNHTLKFTTPDGRLSETYSFEILPADQRPTNEEEASWQIHETACCLLHYISGTAGGRDIEFIAEHFQKAAADFAMITGRDIDTKLNVYLIDRIWGNGGFGGTGELVISYSDRYYGPTVDGDGLEALARHEFTHAVDLGLGPLGGMVEFDYEGLAVYVAGGHYKPEPLAERGAALFDLGHYVPVGNFLSQHELAYLYPAAMLTYIAETYGAEKMWQFLKADDNLEDDQLGSLEGALQSALGVSLKEFDQEFQAWLEKNDPGEQLDDLRLTIELQDLRRQYQDRYAPPPNFLLGQTAEVAKPKYLPIVIREAHAPENIAIELLIANAQRAIAEGAYAEAEKLNKSINKVVSTGEFEDTLAKEYFDIVFAAANAGYEILSLNIQSGSAIAQVTNNPPETTMLEVRKINGVWLVQH